MAQRKSDARTHRAPTPKALASPKILRAKFIDVLIQFCRSSALRLGDTYLAGEMKYRVIHGHVGFEFIDNDHLLVGRALASDLDRCRNKYTAGFFIIAEIRLDFFVCTVPHSLRHDSDLKKVIRIQIDKTDVAVLSHDLQFVRGRPVDILGS